MMPSERIKNYIDEKGITQISLSRKTGISPSKLNSSLKQKRELNLSELELICRALDVDANKFIITKDVDSLAINM